MATRTLNLKIDSAGVTSGEGDKLDFNISSGTNTAFGEAIPTQFSYQFNSSYLYADYSGNVTMQWKFRIKLNGSWYDLHSSVSRTMSKSNSNFSYSGTIPSNVVTLLQSYSIDEVTVYQTGSRVIRGTSSATGTLTITYTEPSYNWNWNYGPSNIRVTSQNNDGTFNIRWNAASWQGPGTVYYYVFSEPSDEREWLVDTTQTSANNILIPAYGNVTIYICGYQYDTYTASDFAYTSVTFSLPSLSTPTISIDPTSGNSTIVTRGESTLSNTDGDIYYVLLRDEDIQVDFFSGPTYEISEDLLQEWGKPNTTFKVCAFALNLTNDINAFDGDFGKFLFSISEPVTFTYGPQKTILYYTGSGPINGYEECIVHYYTGDISQGINGWIECEPYYYTGETNATINGWQLCSYT